MQIISSIIALALASTFATSVGAQSTSTCSNVTSTTTSSAARSSNLLARGFGYRREEDDTMMDSGPLPKVKGAYLRNLTVGAAGEQLVTYWSDAKVSPATSDASVVQAVIMFHGRFRDGNLYWDIGRNATVLANKKGTPGASNNTVVIAPQFFSKKYSVARYTAKQIAFSGNAWEYGGKASFPSGTNVTGFSAIDSLISQLSDKTKFKALKRIILVGHGGGGQVVSRYAVLSDDSTAKAAQISLRYVIGDPSSNLYYTNDRPLRSSFDAQNYNMKSCSGYNNYRYGFTDINSQVPTVPSNPDPKTYFKTFAARDVVFVVGNNDTLPNGDQGGEAILMGGQSRRDRNYMYWRYINLLAGVPNTNSDLDNAGYPGKFSSTLPSWGASTGNTLKAQLTIIDGAKHDAELADAAADNARPSSLIFSTAVKDLITDANFDCNEDGIRLQAMDNSHVALTAIELRAEGFSPYRCDRPMSIGVSLANLTKVVKTGGNDDTLTIRKDDDGDSLSLMFEASKSDRVLEYELMLMDIDSEHLGIPDTQYDAVIRMSSSEFSRIVRDLGSLSESVAIDVSKEGVTFAATGEIGNARLTLKQGSASSASSSAVKMDDDEEDEEDDDDEEVKPKARKRKRGDASGKSSGSGGDGEVPVSIDLQQNVNLTFSLKYLNNFAKAAPLSNAVALHLSGEVPLLVEFSFENGHVRFYLAPKLADDGDA
ncbi:hypothetical protein A4X03_0g799 [Tilletia caries]|uniref:DNA sliding clamp PCNA n=1 Tax=Tilletia caries TaxID=13290 RepID=A0A8T8TR04_9BASI|nr:hypothetical protein A4X03_0g799 [Tilletia caries]